MKLFVKVPFIPPTSNHIYVRGRNGKVFLSKEGAAFKTKMMSHVQQECLPQIGVLQQDLAQDPLALFTIWYVFYFPTEEILNMSFGALDAKGRPAKGAAVTRYKRMDISNRVKLVADAFASAVGVDDSLHFTSGESKCVNTMVGGVSQIHIFFEKADPRGFGL